MDSAIECMVFALNALGNIADSSKFLDVTNEKDLLKICPYNILGKPPQYSTGFIQGYDDYFPSLKSYWHENRELIYTIAEQHDVSKHRSTIFEGGHGRINPPQGFEEIILRYQPKTPRQQRKPHRYEDMVKLEDVAERFCTFINNCGVKALEDAKSRIKLNYYDFIKQ